MAGGSTETLLINRHVIRGRRAWTNLSPGRLDHGMNSKAWAWFGQHNAEVATAERSDTWWPLGDRGQPGVGAAATRSV
jgi:hypothetical protein